MSHEPAQKPGKSVQEVGTPAEFLRAVEGRFGPILFDLAANAANSVCGADYFGPGSAWGEDAMVQPWRIRRGLCWLNPEFADLGPWAAKAAEEGPLGANLTMLTPASIGSTWFARHVFGKALVLGLSPRLTFVGSTSPYPKDLMLSVFGPSVVPGFDVWRWKP